LLQSADLRLYILWFFFFYVIGDENDRDSVAHIPAHAPKRY